jgi:chemotaxis protein CheC
MDNNLDSFDQQLHGLLVLMADEGIHNAARGISSMVGESVTVTMPTIRRVGLTEIPNLLGSPETEAVGIYLRAEGQIASQIMMVIPYHYALELVDLMMGDRPGTAQSLGKMERSALAELGNLTASYFLNAVAATTKLEARPSPPAVMVDMVGAILDIILATSANGLSESVLMIQATFLRGEREAQVDFWVIPDRSTLEAVVRRG